MSIENNHLIEILYAIKLQDETLRELSYFNRYDKRLLDLGKVMITISRLQENMAAIFCSVETAVRNRLTGLFAGYRILIAETYEELANHPNAIKAIFADQMPATFKDKPGYIFVSTSDEPLIDECVIAMKDITPETLKEKVIEAISLFDSDQQTVLQELKKYVGFEPGFRRIDSDMDVQDGFFYQSNIAVLESLRVKLRRKGASTEFRAEHVIPLTNLIIDIRRQIIKHFNLRNMRPAVDCYFSDVSSNLDFLINSNFYTQAALRNKGETDPGALIEAIRYSNQGTVRQGGSGSDYIAQIDRERYLIDGMVALSAANHVAPVIKVPLSNSRLFSKVSDLATVERGDGKKIDAMMHRLKGTLATYLGEWFEYFDSVDSASIKLVSNLPLEWASHEGLPLMIRHSVSRIRVTPGYVATKLLLDQDNIHLTLKAFREILFISSFSENDPIRDHLKEKLRVIQDLVDKAEERAEALKLKGLLPADVQIPVDSREIDVRINWVEVSTRSELVEAINRNPCAVTVFDLHGGHSTQGCGVIELKDEVVSVFDICRDIRISPIVILSACDTSPVDRGHNSTAEAFFLAGAKTLISSALPINSDLASTFLARLLLRIKIFLPIRVGKGIPIRWSELVTGMTRRAYYHELICRLQNEYHFDDKTKHDVLFAIGSVLDPLHPDWVNLIDQKITSNLELGSDQLKAFVDKKGQFMECMKYIQLGRPESIIISADGEY